MTVPTSKPWSKKTATSLAKPTVILRPQLLVVILVSAGILLLASRWMKNYQRSHALTMSAINTQQVAKIEEEFLLQMIPHHQEAILSSQYIFSRTKNDTVKKFAENLVNTQTKQMWTMLGWYHSWFGRNFPPQTEYHNMMPDLTHYTGNDLDQVYLQGMIEHHKEAVIISQQILSVTTRDDLKTLASDIAATQTQEIAALTNLLSQYQTPVSK